MKRHGALWQHGGAMVIFLKLVAAVLIWGALMAVAGQATPYMNMDSPQRVPELVLVVGAALAVALWLLLFRRQKLPNTPHS